MNVHKLFLTFDSQLNKQSANIMEAIAGKCDEQLYKRICGLWNGLLNVSMALRCILRKIGKLRYVNKATAAGLDEVIDQI